jgi:hypothetical protein
MLPFRIWRLFDEGRMLAANLAGYVSVSGRSNIG